jgi:hypothetical protein
MLWPLVRWPLGQPSDASQLHQGSRPSHPNTKEFHKSAGLFYLCTITARTLRQALIQHSRQCIDWDGKEWEHYNMRTGQEDCVWNPEYPKVLDTILVL